MMFLGSDRSGITEGQHTTTIVLAVCASLTLTSLALAETADPKRDIFLKAVKDNGCQMTEDEAAFALPPLGLQKEDVQAMIPDLLAEGVIELDPEKFNLILHAEGCPE